MRLDGALSQVVQSSSTPPVHFCSVVAADLRGFCYDPRMTLSISSLLLAVLGALVFILADKAPSAKELGRLTFTVALLAALLHASWDVALRLGR